MLPRLVGFFRADCRDIAKVLEVRPPSSKDSRLVSRVFAHCNSCPTGSLKAKVDTTDSAECREMAKAFSRAFSLAFHHCGL